MTTRFVPFRNELTEVAGVITRIPADELDTDCPQVLVIEVQPDEAKLPSTNQNPYTECS